MFNDKELHVCKYICGINASIRLENEQQNEMYSMFSFAENHHSS